LNRPAHITLEYTNSHDRPPYWVAYSGSGQQGHADRRYFPGTLEGYQACCAYVLQGALDVVDRPGNRADREQERAAATVVRHQHENQLIAKFREDFPGTYAEQHQRIDLLDLVNLRAYEFKSQGANLYAACGQVRGYVFLQRKQGKRYASWLVIDWKPTQDELDFIRRDRVALCYLDNDRWCFV
jgi:hypothetical protein